MRLSTALLASLLSTHALADIHTCEINQQTVYSDTPCSNIQKTISSSSNTQESNQWWEGAHNSNPYKHAIVIDGPLDERFDRVAGIISEA